MKNVLRAILILVSIVVVLYAGLVVYAYLPSPAFEPVVYEPVRPDYWPTDGWRTSTPEEQGMDSAKLLGLYDFYAKAHERNPENAIDAISVYRNGYLVADYYFNPLYPRDTPHIIHSCTKSIMSALIGIAIEQAYIEGVDVPMVAFFPDKQHAITDARIKEITIKDLLSMETGIRSRDWALYEWEGLSAMQQTDDWVAHILSLPVDAEPGVRYDYSNMSSFLLSAIIHRATGMDTLDYARENLFDPIGIGKVRWDWSPQGFAVGYARMWMTPENMAKFGLLYLQQGQWNGKQIVPAAWIRESLTPHAFPKNLVDVLDENGKRDQQLSSTNWQAANLFRPFSDGYGYQWWLDKDSSYSAVGVGGQYIMVAPEENLVVVVNSASSGLGVFFPRKVLDKVILPSIVSDRPIAANQAAYNELVARSGPPDLANERQPVPELPATALEISGKTYSLQENYFHYDHFRLTFDPALDYAAFSYTVEADELVSFQVGLDSAYRFSETETGSFAAYGNWIAPDTFDIDSLQIGYSSGTKFVLTFDGNTITVQEFGVVGSSTYSGVAE
jgi:CubicO group peptidase (beta-lactamase class C family)